MPYTPKYNSDAIIAGAEQAAEKYRSVDLRDVLRNAFIIEDGLRAYLNRKCGCWFAEVPHGSGKFALQSTREGTKGVNLAHDLDFLTMLEIALARAKVDAPEDAPNEGI